MIQLQFGDQERKDILELDALSDDALKYNFGYGIGGIDNLRRDAEEIRSDRNKEMKDYDTRAHR